jgi:hypothetical protein
MDYVRIWADADGESHLEDVTVPGAHTPAEPGVAPLTVAEPVPVTGVLFTVAHGGEQDPDWHTAPRRQFVVFLDVGCRIETSDGDGRELPPGSIVLAEDTHGRGHRTTHLATGDARVLQIPLA